MPKTRSAIKAEPVDTISAFVPASRARTISSSSTPLPEPVMSSGNTTVVDDAIMAGMSTTDTPLNDSSDGTMEIDDTIAATSTPAASQATQPLPQHRQMVVDGGRSTKTSIQHTDALHTLAAGSRDLIQAIRTLNSLNIKATLPSLPKFVVVGDQSAGKSSIIEACCDITLPRSEGTCTRCPFEITTTALMDGTAVTWKCTISLVLEYSYLPRERPQEPFGHWHATDKQIVTFAIVDDKTQLEQKLKLAQLAILNPDTDPANYANLADASGRCRKVAFSPNVIRLDVQAPHLPELSFFDLPGANNVHEDAKEQHLVTFIEKLIASYLSNKQALVLLTCAANQDVQNSTVYRFVYKCIGVLTKLDLMYPTKVPEIEAMLAGELFPLPCGSWFITKQPGPDELAQGISYGEGRTQERVFFGSGHWITIGHRFDQQVGIGNLQSAISKLYTGHVLKYLPEITGRVDKRLSDVDQALSGFAARPKQAAVTINTEIQNIVAAISEQIEGDGIALEYSNAKSTLIQGFVKEMKGNRPAVDWTTPGYVKRAISLVSSDDEVTPTKSISTPTPAPRVKPDVAPTTSTLKRRLPASAHATPSKKSKPDSSKVIFSIAPVLRAHHARDHDGTGAWDPRVTRTLILSTFAGWTQITDAFLHSLQNATANMLSATLRSTLASRLHTEFYHETQRLLTNFATDLYASFGNSITHALARELHRPITISGAQHQAAITFEKTLREERHKVRVEEHFSILEASLPSQKQTTIEQRLKRANEPTWVAADPDPHHNLVGNLASVLAYHDLACNRFVDLVAGTHAYDVLRVLKGNVEEELKKELPVGNEEACQALLAEDAGRERVRDGLVKEKEQLVKAKSELEKVGGMV
ncbi:hypothetical protein LTR95_012187 [Oleoguttula sp. CCFEE 5521]